MIESPSSHPTLLAILSVCLGLAGPTIGAPAPDGSSPSPVAAVHPPDDPPAETTDDPLLEPPDEAQETEDLESLDELLGLESDESSDGARDAARRDAEEALERQLTEAEVHNAFEEALSKMDVAAELLEGRLDPGLGTQRVQEEVLAKLDILIENARRQQGNASSSSGSSGSQNNRPQQPRQQQDNQQENRDGNENRRGGENRGENDPPPRQDGDINNIIDETRSEWGNLPDRIRDLMVQGSNDRYSSLYEQLTQLYYRRLAEESSQ